MDYADKLIDRYRDKYNTVGGNLKREALFPDKNNLTKPLDEARTLILQTLFRVKVGFLEEFTCIFSLLFYKQKFEKVILELEEIGLIESKQTSFGKAFLLTKDALYYIYKNEANNGEEAKVSPDVFPSEKKLAHYKLLNGILSFTIFQKVLMFIESEYRAKEKPFRTDYTKKQYLTNFVYKDSSDVKTFSKKSLDEFLNAAMPSYFLDEKHLVSYREFVKAFKENTKDCSVKSLQLKNAFYRDFALSLFADKGVSIHFLRIPLETELSNLFRENPFEFWKKLYEESGKSQRIRLDFNRFYYEEIEKILSITKRAVLGKNTGEGGTAAGEILSDISSIDKKLASIKGMNEAYVSQFEVMGFQGFSSTDIPQFAPEVVTLDCLKRNGVYVESLTKVTGEKPILSFAVMIEDPENIPQSSFFKKLESLYLYSLNNLIVFDIQINIYTYCSKDYDILLEKFKRIIQLFKDAGTSYACFIDILLSADIITTEIHPTERFKVFRDFAKSNHLC